MISGLNHITLAVSNLERSLLFYCDTLGCELAHKWDGGAYLEAGNLWLCLTVCDAVDQHEDYTHVAFTSTPAGLSALRLKLTVDNAGFWQENSSEGDSLYILDPDGHKLEIHVGTLRSRLRFLQESAQVSSGCSTV